MDARSTESPAPFVAHLGFGWESVRRASLAAAAPRYLATAVLLVFLTLGLRATFWPPQPERAVASTSTGADAPCTRLRPAVRPRLSHLRRRASRRPRRALAPFLPAGLDPGAGFFAASGERRVRWAQVASDQPALAGGRAITVAAGVSSQRAPLYLAVTVRHQRGRGLALLGYPAFVGAPSIDTAAAPQPRSAGRGPRGRRVSTA